MDALFSHLMFLIIIIFLFAGRGIAEKAQALFVFGDSYADTGNRDPYNQSVNQPWRRPYGLAWPGYPAGRFSSGKIQTDFWGDILGLPIPISYELLKSHDCKATAKKIRQGVNFAVGGSGIFRAYGFKTVAQQVKQFKEVKGGRHGFHSRKLSRSVVLISASGNDYSAFLDSRNGSTKVVQDLRPFFACKNLTSIFSQFVNLLRGLIDLVKPVVSGTIDAVKDMYESGLRNFAVRNINHWGCRPQIGKTSCNSNYDDILALHTRLLRESVESLRSDLKELSIIILDHLSAIYHIFSNPAQYGFVDLFIPCCAEKGGIDKCGEVDEVGRALFEVCSNIDEKFYWDDIHPTQRGWDAIMSLYSKGALGKNKTMSFIEGAPNVIEWLHSLGFVAYNVST